MATESKSPDSDSSHKHRRRIPESDEKKWYDLTLDTSANHSIARSNHETYYKAEQVENSLEDQQDVLLAQLAEYAQSDPVIAVYVSKSRALRQQIEVADDLGIGSVSDASAAVGRASQHTHAITKTLEGTLHNPRYGKAAQ